MERARTEKSNKNGTHKRIRKNTVSTGIRKKQTESLISGSYLHADALNERNGTIVHTDVLKERNGTILHTDVLKERDVTPLMHECTQTTSCNNTNNLNNLTPITLITSLTLTSLITVVTLIALIIYRLLSLEQSCCLRAGNPGRTARECREPG